MPVEPSRDPNAVSFRAAAAYRWTAVGVAAIAACVAAVVGLPARTVTTRYLNDLLIFVDGAHRVLSGQVPHRDYHTPIGSLADLIPATGLLVTGSAGGAMPVGIALLIVALAPVMAHLLGSRLPPLMAWPLALCLALVVAAPATLDGGPVNLSFAMFYNRIGWTCLSLLLLMYLPPHGRCPKRDGLCAAVLMLILLYTKITYAGVALVFLAFMIIDRAARPWVVAALGSAMVVTLLLELAWTLPSAYFVDLGLAGRSSGAIRGGLPEVARTFWSLAPELAAFGLAAVIALHAGRNGRDLAFFGLCAAGGLLIINQNYQHSGMIVLVVGAAVAVAIVQRRAVAPGAGLVWRHSVVLVLFFLLLLPRTVERAAALGLHAVLAVTSSPHPFGILQFADIVLVDADTPFSDHYRYTLTWVETLDEGGRALSTLEPPPHRVTVFDFVNPFSAGLGLPPPRGDSSWNYLGRNFDPAHYLPAERYLGEVAVVMVPKRCLHPPTCEALDRLYGEYLAERFDRVRDTASWEIHVRRTPLGQ